MNSIDYNAIINMVWAVIAIVAIIGSAFYLHHKNEILKMKAKHPLLGEALDQLGQLAVKASGYQSTLDDKSGEKKLTDATAEVYQQLKRWYPNIPISEDTVRNAVQSAYDNANKSGKTLDNQTETPKIDKNIVIKTEIPDEIKPAPETSPVPVEQKEGPLDDLHI